jgi:ubiquinone/menaquinone biosynthesis C-methylase UbiE
MLNFDERAKDWDADPVKRERASQVAQAIRSQVTLSRSMTALEYGCGTGLLSFALQADLGPITLADSSTGMLAVLAEKIATAGIGNMTPLKLDLATDPLPDARFDLLYTLMTLHHIPDTTGILGRFHTLLQTGGTLCIADLDREDGSFHGPAFDGHKGFDREQLTQMLEVAGFQNIRFQTAHQMTRDGKNYPVFLACAETV